MAKTIVGELKELAVKMGANADDLKSKRTTVGMIDVLGGLVDNLGSGGSQSSGGGALIVHQGDGGALDKTYAEIAAAAETSTVILVLENDGFYDFFYLNSLAPSMFGVEFSSLSTVHAFMAGDADSYPEPYQEQQEDIPAH